MLVQLALRGQTGDAGSRARAIGKRPLTENTGRGKLVGVSWRRAERVSQCEEAVPGESGVARRGGGCTARAKFQKVEVVIVDQEHDGDSYYQNFEHKVTHKVHADN